MENKKALLGLFLGVVLLSVFSLTLGHLSTNSPTLSQGLEQSQSAAAWWAQYPPVEVVWPVSHSAPSSERMSGTCNTRYYTCPLPSYTDIFVTADPTKKIVARSVLPGYYFGFQAQTVTYTPSTPTLTVPAGTPLTIEWACQDFQQVGFTYTTCTAYDALNNCINPTQNTGRYTQNYYSRAVGTGFTAGTNIGSTQVTPSTSTTYGVYCQSAGATFASGATFPSTPTMSFTVTVLPGPTLTITGNGTNPTTAIAGQPVVINATYTPPPGDTLTKTAINDFENNLWCGSGNACDSSMWTSPLTPKTYTFTPTTAGTYVFYPAAQTINNPSWDNYGTSLIITVINACENGNGAAGACTSCNAGYTLSGSVCVVNACPGGHNNPPACNSCDLGYIENSSGVCVASGCSDPYAVAPLCNTCQSGYTLQGSVCTATPPAINSFTATPTRVRPGTTALLSWSVSNPPASCTITGNNGFSTTLNGAQLPADGSQRSRQTNAITYSTTFTLSCGSASRSTTVGVLPVFQEI
ncbi:MAG TPA: hypothetical protein VJJ20_03875 [Candidatus Paceibacterota bacterium]